jgi:NADH-quinone oxidoreductase subunit E
MAQIGKDYYEDLTADKLRALIDDMAAGKVPTPGPQNGRYAAEPASGLSSLTAHAEGRAPYNASAGLATDLGDTLKRIDGTEVPLITPWQWKDQPAAANNDAPAARPTPAADIPADDTGVTKQQATATGTARPEVGRAAPAASTSAAAAIAPEDARRPAALSAARDGTPDDLKMIKGVGPKLESLLHSMGFFHFDQVAGWTAEEIAWVDQNLEGFKGRVIRDDWVAQAALLATGQETDFSKRAKY